MAPKKIKFYPLDQSPFYRCTTKAKLAKALRLSLKELKDLTKNGLHYSEWDEQKETGGLRHIENPNYKLKVVQKRIAKMLARIEPPAMLYCPVKGRSYVSNAAYHKGQKVIRTLDIRKYFPSTSSKRVNWFWRTRMQCSDDVAGILTALNRLNGHLPTGSPSSPVLSFYAHMDIWEAVAAIAEKSGLRVSIYIDDITLSGEKIPKGTLGQIKNVIAGAQLKYHKEKSFEAKVGEITGVLVDGDKIKPPNRMLKAMHEIRSEIKRNPPEEKKVKLLVRYRSYRANLKQIEKAS